MAGEQNSDNKLETGNNAVNGLDEKQPPPPYLVVEETAQKAAASGHVATDKYGRPIVHFDPLAEKRLCRKIDFFVVPIVSLLYLFCFIDRANIGNARLAGLEKDLHLKGYDYNKVLSVFYISYIIFEIPGTMACKIIGPGKFLPICTLGFGICSVCTAFCHDIHAVSGVRFLLGVFEAPLMPGISYYLSRWYRRGELGFRLSLFLVMAPLAGAFGGLLASGILKLSHFGGLHTWRMIFAIEGVVTIGISILGYFTLTDRPETAKWLSREEKDLAAARLKSERVATTDVLDKLDIPKIKRGVFNPATLGMGFIFLLNNITVQGLAFFLPTIVATIYPGRSVIFQQLRTVPPYVVGAGIVVLNPYISWKIDRRVIFFIICAPLMIIGYAMFLGTTKARVRYGATFLVASGAYTFGPLSNALASANVVSDSARTSAIGTNVMFGNIGGLIATWSFLPFDGPNFHIGNGLNLATSCMALIVSILMLVLMKMANRRRDKRQEQDMAKLDEMSPQQIQDLDWKHPGFRWRP